MIVPMIAVVIPSYRVKSHILRLLSRIGPEVDAIYVIDDACPENSGDWVYNNCTDRRVTVIAHEINQGVGGAVITGYERAVADGAEVVVKLDGDEQMDPSLIPQFIKPILEGRADYVKGNRFYNVEDLRAMPRTRLIGNAGLSFLTKLSSGYWNMFDPTNGYTAISAAIISHLPLARIRRRYFFESDMLFRLGTIQAVVIDLPMTAIYGDEESGLDVASVFFPFLWGNARNFAIRIFYNYFLRGFSVASLELVAGLALLIFGFSFGAHGWVGSIRSGLPATTGTVMLAALPIILGAQLVLSFLSFDGASTPSRPMSAFLPRKGLPSSTQAVIRSSRQCGTILSKQINEDLP